MEAFAAQNGRLFLRESVLKCIFRESYEIGNSFNISANNADAIWHSVWFLNADISVEPLKCYVGRDNKWILFGAAITMIMTKRIPLIRLTNSPIQCFWKAWLFHRKYICILGESLPPCLWIANVSKHSPSEIAKGIGIIGLATLLQAPDRRKRRTATPRIANKKKQNKLLPEPWDSTITLKLRPGSLESESLNGDTELFYWLMNDGYASTTTGHVHSREGFVNLERGSARIFVFPGAFCTGSDREHFAPPSSVATVLEQSGHSEPKSSSWSAFLDGVLPGFHLYVETAVWRNDELFPAAILQKKKKHSGRLQQRWLQEYEQRMFKEV